MIASNDNRCKATMTDEPLNSIQLHGVYMKLLEAESDIAEGRVSDAHTSLLRLKAKYGILAANP